MNDRYLYRAKRKNWRELPKEKWWVEGYYAYMQPYHYIMPKDNFDSWIEIDEKTLCACTGLKDKNGNLILENDILMGHGNPKDIAKVVFGEFFVINVETLERIDKVVGWHYEVIPTDAISKCEPFCIPMPLTDEYIERCEFEVIGSAVDNPELLEVGE